MEDPINIRQEPPRFLKALKEPTYYGLIEQLAYKDETYWDKLKAIVTAPDFIVKTLFAIINILTIYAKKK